MTCPSKICTVPDISEIISIDYLSVLNIIKLVTFFQLSRAGQDIPNVLLAVALFNVYPLQFVGVAEITRKVRNSNIKSLCGLQIVMTDRS